MGVDERDSAVERLEDDTRRAAPRRQPVWRLEERRVVREEHVGAQLDGTSDRRARRVERQSDAGHFALRVASEQTDVVPVLGPLQGEPSGDCALDVGNGDSGAHSASSFHPPRPSGNETDS